MKRFCAAILTLSLLAAALSGCGAAQSAPETTAAQTAFPTETAAPETTVPETQPEVEPAKTNFPWWILVICVVRGCGLGMVIAIVIIPKFKMKD